MNALSIRPFVGAKNYDLSRSFYRAIGFSEVVLSPNMSLFKTDTIGFYLQDFYVADWIDNTMLFVEVSNVQEHYNNLVALDLPAKYPGVRVKPIVHDDWGSECFLHDPCGVLWHFGQFNQL